MLPDYPRTKSKLWKFYMKVMRQAHQRHLGFFGEIKASIMHEGEMDVIVREDGSITDLVPRIVRSEGSIPADSPDIELLKPEDIMKALHEVGRGFADEKAKLILETIEEATKRVGTYIGPHPDSAEQLLEMIEKRRFDFDKEGRPIWGDLVVGDMETAEVIRETMERISSTPELKRRMELLIEQKRGEFLDREAARKLVD